MRIYHVYFFEEKKHFLVLRRKKNRIFPMCMLIKCRTVYDIMTI